MEYFFFRDLDHESNLKNGKTFHPYGLVETIVNTSPKESGKDLVVIYFDAFSNIVDRVWRSYDEVELFQVSEHEYEGLKRTFEALQKE